MTTILQSSLSVQQQQEQLFNLINGEGSGTPGVDGTGSTDGTDNSPPTYLTPDALLTYCETRLQGIDSQVQQMMAEQNNINTEQSGIQSLLTEISGYASAAGTGDMDNAANCLAMEKSLETLIAQIQQTDPSCSQLGALEQLHDTMMATGTGAYTSTDPTGGYYCSSTTNPPTPNGDTPPTSSNGVKPDNTFSQADFTNFTSTLTNINSSLNSGAEINMIKIQSLMSDRTTAISLTTNILQSYDDGLSKIADNIGK